MAAIPKPPSSPSPPMPAKKYSSRAEPPSGKVAALIEEGSYLQRHHQLLPPWKQAVKHRRELAGAMPKRRVQRISPIVHAHTGIAISLPLPRASSPRLTSESESLRSPLHGRRAARRARERSHSHGEFLLLQPPWPMKGRSLSQRLRQLEQALEHLHRCPQNCGRQGTGRPSQIFGAGLPHRRPQNVGPQKMLI
jgi:hypothetical protein